MPARHFFFFFFFFARSRLFFFKILFFMLARSWHHRLALALAVFSLCHQQGQAEAAAAELDPNHVNCPHILARSKQGLFCVCPECHVCVGRKCKRSRRPDSDSYIFAFPVSCASCVCRATPTAAPKFEDGGADLIGSFDFKAESHSPTTSTTTSTTTLNAITALSSAATTTIAKFRAKPLMPTTLAVADDDIKAPLSSINFLPLKIIYIKSYKVGSTTVASIFQRIADERELKVCVRVRVCVCVCVCVCACTCACMCTCVLCVFV